MRKFAQIKRTALTGLLALILGVVTTPPVSASALALTDVPLFIDLKVEPNVVVSLDDSGSMRRCFILDEAIGESRVEKELGMTANAVNALAYSPKIEYVVPVDGNGVTLGIPPFTGAWEDGYNKNDRKGNLEIQFVPCWDALSDYEDQPLTQRAAYYHTFSGNPKSESSVENQSNYTRIVVGSAADVSIFDGQANENNLEKQNFANWFSYYRNRFNTMKSAAGRAFVASSLGGPNAGDGNIRVAYQGLWGKNGAKSNRKDIGLMQMFEGGARNDFFSWLYNSQKSGSTPLRYTIHKAGLYYSNKRIASATGTTPIQPINKPENSPWAFEPGVTKDPEFTCRQAFHVLLTDGSWNNDEGVLGDIDGNNATYPEALDTAGTLTTYTQFPPYEDSDSATLADNAFEYWVNDLRPDLANDVPAYMPDPTPHPVTGNVEDNPKNDPATWQHMVNFTVGFGVDGDMAFPGDYDALVDGSKQWTGDKVDDLWHAAINSRGEYLSAKNPDDLVNAFTAALNAVLARTSSGASVALNSGSLDTNSRLYQGRFNSGTWSGQLLAFDINQSDGSVAGTESWDAGALLTTRVAGSGWNTNREVITFNGTQGIPFLWASLNSAMQTDLDTNSAGVNDGQGQARLEYLRGSAADEGVNGNKYRARSTKLGDIIDSSPVFVGAPGFNYPDGLESQAYAGFASSNTNRPKMVYVGANDGMLHGFDASTGEEKIAYVPNKVFPNLSRLGDASYAHRFYVNGSPTAGDAFVSGAWRTVLVGGMRKGGRAIYALDVTDPASFDEANASSLVLWEFTDADDADLGYTYSRPAIVRMNNGKWAAVFGNGYNNTGSGHAVLFIVDIGTGALIRKIDTLAGSSATPNGLATVAPVDVDGDRIIDYIYAGDLLGNMWKFDVTNGTAGNWDVAYKSGATPVPLYVAKDGAGVRQPITTPPEVGPHPQNTSAGANSDGGYMVYFGTGKYIASGDNVTAGAQTQTFYGVWDPNESSLPPGFDRTNLLQQQILDEVTSKGAEVRITTDNQISWRPDPMTNSANDHLGWYMDLINVGATPLDNAGERQITTPVLRNGRIIFTTLIPSGSSCVFGGDGWIMEIDLADGSRLGDPPFDLDDDGVFDLVDDGNGNMVPPGGIKSTGGAPSAPGILDRGDGQEYKYVSGTDSGAIQVISEQGPPGGPGGGTRESWQQLR